MGLSDEKVQVELMHLNKFLRMSGENISMHVSLDLYFERSGDATYVFIVNLSNSVGSRSSNFRVSSLVFSGIRGGGGSFLRSLRFLMS